MKNLHVWWRALCLNAEVKRGVEKRSFFYVDNADYIDLIGSDTLKQNLDACGEIGLGVSRHFVCFVLALCLWLTFYWF